MIDCVKVQLHLFVFNSAFGAIIRVGVMFKNFFGPTYVDNQISFLEVQPYLFAFNSATFGVFFAFSPPSWLFCFCPFE